MAYDVQSWLDGAAGNTPVNAARLNHIESGIAAADSAATAAASAATTTAAAAQASASSVVADVADLEATTTALAIDVANKAQISHSHVVADMPSGTTLTVFKTGSSWPARPTARADITVQWVGADPSPAIVTSGTGGMLSGSDLRWATA
jgi:hypothetical protein